MTEVKKITMPKLFDMDGTLVEDFKNIPSGTRLKNDCGAYFVVFRDGDKETTTPRQVTPVCGPQFV